MSLRARLARLEKAFRDPDAPKLVVITTAQDRHGIDQITRDHVALSVPWNEGCDPLDALTDEQRALIGPGDRVRALIVPSGCRRTRAE